MAGFSFVDIDLVLLACCTSLNIVGNPGYHSRPGIVLLHFSDGFVPFQMPYHMMAIDQGHKVPFV